MIDRTKNRRVIARMRAAFTPRWACALVTCALMTTLAAPAIARQWHDASGQLEVEGELVSANDELVVVRADQDDLVAFEVRELSAEDQAFVRGYLKSRPIQESPLDPSAPQLHDPAMAKRKSVPPGAASRNTQKPALAKDLNADYPAPEQRTQWKLTTGEVLEGEFFGFDFEPLVVARRLSKVYVGNTVADELNPLYQELVPLAVAKLADAEISNMDALEEWLARVGPGPWRYNVESVVIDSEAYGRVSVPLFFLEDAPRETLEAAHARWKAAYESQASDEDRSRYERRERFLTRAELSARRAGSRVAQQVRLLRLEQLAANTNLLELWEVLLLPKAYGYPFYAVVPGRTSLDAERYALAHYPGYILGGVQKATW